MIDGEESGRAAELEVSICYDTEWDEMWSFVGSKANPRWLWYLLERRSGMIVAYHLGRRTDASLAALLAKVEHLPIRFCNTDDWGAYGRLMPCRPGYIHQVSKSGTWKIERRNLNFRIHIKRLNRRTICFSKDEQIHDNVIGLYINKHYFKSSQFNARAA